MLLVDHRLATDADIKQRYDATQKHQGRLGAIRIRRRHHGALDTTLVTFYAPTDKAARPVKQAYWQEYTRVIQSLPQRTIVIGMGDANARVGHAPGEPVDDTNEHIGPVGAETQTEQGELFAQALTDTNHCALNTYKAGTFTCYAGERHRLDYIVTPCWAPWSVGCLRFVPWIDTTWYPLRPVYSAISCSLPARHRLSAL